MVGFITTTTVAAEKICDQVCSAFEGGSNYWIDHVDLVLPTDRDEIPNPEKLIWYGRNALYEGEFDILIVEQESHKAGQTTEWHLTRDAVTKGLAIMAEKYGDHYSDLMNENGDAETADVFLQCCLFGDLIYG